MRVRASAGVAVPFLRASACSRQQLVCCCRIWHGVHVLVCGGLRSTQWERDTGAPRVLRADCCCAGHGGGVPDSCFGGRRRRARIQAIGMARHWCARCCHQGSTRCAGAAQAVLPACACDHCHHYSFCARNALGAGYRSHSGRLRGEHAGWKPDCRNGTVARGYRHVSGPRARAAYVTVCRRAVRDCVGIRFSLPATFKAPS